jgi:hypothetical protein
VTELSAARAALYGAVVTTVGLVGSLLLSIAAGSAIRAVLAGTAAQGAVTLLATVVALVGLGAGAGAWGVFVGRLMPDATPKRMAWAGLLGFVPITLIAGFALLALEPIALRRWSEQIPMHRLFTLLFVPAAAIIAGTAALALGIGLRRRALGWALAWRCALAAALTFLVVDLIMEALGWRVGAPGAAERITMVTVLSLSALGAAIVAGAVIGVRLNRLTGKP